MLKDIYIQRERNLWHTDRPYKKTSYLVSSPTIWDLEFAKEIAAVTEQPPRNGFEEMIQWTKEGILWEFPIDNEAGMCTVNFDYLHVFIIFENCGMVLLDCFKTQRFRL